MRPWAFLSCMDAGIGALYMAVEKPLRVWKHEFTEARVHYLKCNSRLSCVQSRSWPVVRVLCVCAGIQCFGCASEIENPQAHVSVIHLLETFFSILLTSSCATKSSSMDWRATLDSHYGRHLLSRQEID